MIRLWSYNDIYFAGALDQLVNIKIEFNCQCYNTKYVNVQWFNPLPAGVAYIRVFMFLLAH